MVPSLRFAAGVVALVVSFALASVSVAQFTVVDSSPADGDTNVPLNATITLNFSAPLDTTAAFEQTDGFYLAVETIPETGDPSSIVVSPDKRTFTVQLTLDADTRYIILVTGARSESGDPLAVPYAATFTTGATLPSGSVSGSVTESLTKVQGDRAAVAVFPDDPVNGLFGSGDGNPAGVSVVRPDGSFTINYVEDGRYHAVSVLDRDLNGQLDFAPGDAFGLYDADGDQLVDSFDLTGGTEVTGIDIEIRSPEPATAQQNLPTAQTLAETFYSDAAVTSVAGEIGADGRATFWIYLFYSQSTNSYFALVNVGYQFARSVVVDDGGGSFDIMTPLPNGWLDSDVIMGIANENGGGDFMSQWENVDISATAASFTGFFDGGNGTEVAAKVGGSTRVFGGRRSAGRSFEAAAAKSSGSTTPTPVWFVNYYGYNLGGPSSFLSFMIHAVTGEVDPPLAFYTSGRENLEAANALAAAWASDADLVKVSSGSSGVHRAGLSSDWSYTYYSSTLTKTGQAAARTFAMQENELLNEFETSVGSLFSLEALPDSWIDTPTITSTADANSGDFRSTHTGVYVQSILSRGIISWDLSRPVWQYDYYGSSDNVTVLVNAVSGGVIVGTEDEEVPSALSLDQNYPNPFNPTTTIAYDVPVSGGVTIRIFDALGRQVRLLVDRNHTPGKYTVVWDGKDDATKSVSSGIYIYKLEAGRETATRSMILLR